ncbi:MAG: GNAT family N-acetyltransferase [Ilumatobacteraceae bacterium]
MTYSEFQLRHDPELRRYTLLVAGRPSSFADYRPVGDGSTLLFHHTVTPPPDRGRGYAAELVARALNDVRASGRTVAATCWYVDQFVEAHPEYVLDGGSAAVSAWRPT